MGRQAPVPGGQPPGSNNLWRRFRSRPPAIQGLALVAVMVLVLGAAKVATSRAKQNPASAVSASPLGTTAKSNPSVGATTTSAATTTTKVPVPVVSAPVAATGKLETKWIYLQGSVGIPKSCAHPGYQIAVTNSLGQTLGLGTIQLGSATVSQPGDGTTAVTCLDSYTVTVSQAATYTFSLMLQSASAKPRATQVITLGALRASGAPSLSSTEG